MSDPAREREPAIERRLGVTERFMWLVDQTSRINFLMHARIRGTFAEASLRTGLKSIQARHPMLRVRIVREGRSDARFESGGVADIPLRVVEAPEAAWPDEAERELAIELPVDRGPLLRCVLIRHESRLATLLLTFHHAIGDATSGAYLVRDLVQATALAESGEDPRLPELAPKDSIESCYPARSRGVRGFVSYLVLLGRMILALFAGGPPAMPARERRAPLARRRVRLLARELAPSLVARALDRARAEQTTLHGALAAALELAVARDLGSKRTRNYFIATPVSLRERLVPPVGESVGFFVMGGVSINRVRPDMGFWAVARAAQASLARSVDRGEPFALIHWFRSLDLWTRLLGAGPIGAWAYASYADRTRAPGIALSNIGRLDLETRHGALQIEALGFAAALSALGSFSSNTATLDGRMTWSFAWMEPLYSKEHIERIADDAIATLTRAVE